MFLRLHYMHNSSSERWVNFAQLNMIQRNGSGSRLYFADGNHVDVVEPVERIFLMYDKAHDEAVTRLKQSVNTNMNA